MAKRTAGRGAVEALAMFAAVPVVLVVASALAVRARLLPVSIGYDLLTLQVAWWLSFLAAAAGLLALILAVRNFGKLGLVALVALVLGVGSLAGFGWQKARLLSGPGENVSTDLNEVPGFGRMRSDAGGGAAVGADVCPGARPLMKQVAPQVAGWALEQAGFQVRGTGVGRADGSRDSFFFGFTHDAVIRIRPGRTDVRVAARDGRPHGGEACRLATRISEALHTDATAGG
ncbi:hypothetical protein GCM10009422_16380 [Brevundimonas kwangchunensis]|uniref:DUF1499 domain-containing protein n=1 Tax=Brevundimonas kwangchunensis TaxID=322163 RepID=A0ABP3S4G6_9CAUL